MTLFELTPLPWRGGLTLKDRKGRAYRRRPWWVDVGKGPDGATCKSCHWLTKVEFSKTYYKCGRQPITHGPGTQIAMRDAACSLYQRKGMAMIAMKPDIEPFPSHLFKHPRSTP